MTDWSNLEELNALQMDLIMQYGLEATAVTNYITTLKSAAKPVSSLLTTIDTFGGLYEASQQVEKSLSKITAL
jgi:hypothetical protein